LGLLKTGLLSKGVFVDSGYMGPPGDTTLRGWPQPGVDTSTTPQPPGTLPFGSMSPSPANLFGSSDFSALDFSTAFFGHEVQPPNSSSSSAKAMDGLKGNDHRHHSHHQISEGANAKLQGHQQAPAHQSQTHYQHQHQQQDYFGSGLFDNTLFQLPPITPTPGGSIDEVTSYGFAGGGSVSYPGTPSSSSHASRNATPSPYGYPKRSTHATDRGSPSASHQMTMATSAAGKIALNFILSAFVFNVFHF